MASSFWQDRPVFVTGTTGLVGGHLISALLERNALVVALVRETSLSPAFPLATSQKRLTLVRGDCRDFELLKRTLAEFEIQTAFHLAAQTLVGVAQAEPLSTLEINVAGTYRLLEAVRQCPTPPQLVVSSSDQAYHPHEPLPFKESSRLEGQHPYAVSKSCADLIAQTYAATYQLPIGIARCGNLYGSGDRNWNRLIPGTLHAILHGERPVIRSNGRHLREYLYVQDAVDAQLRLAEALEKRPNLYGQAFNIGTGHPVSVLEVVDTICRVCHREDLLPDVRNDAKNEVLNQSLDVTKAQELLGWQTQYSLEAGLEATVPWYRELFSL